MIGQSQVWGSEVPPKTSASVIMSKVAFVLGLHNVICITHYMSMRRSFDGWYKNRKKTLTILALKSPHGQWYR